MSKSVLNQVRNYKNVMTGDAHSLFRDLLYIKLSGVTFDGRQKNLEQVNKTTPLRLVRDRRNEHDFYAVLVEALIEDEWKDVGFIPSKHNTKIALTLDAGIKLSAKVWGLSGGENDFFRGLSITVKRED